MARKWKHFGDSVWQLSKPQTRHPKTTAPRVTKLSIRLIGKLRNTRKISWENRYKKSFFTNILSVVGPTSGKSSLSREISKLKKQTSYWMNENGSKVSNFIFRRLTLKLKYPPPNRAPQWPLSFWSSIFMLTWMLWAIPFREHRYFVVEDIS